MKAIIGGSPAAVSAIANGPRKVTDAPAKVVDDNFGNVSQRAPNGTPVSKRKSDDEILAELKSIT